MKNKMENKMMIKFSSVPTNEAFARTAVAAFVAPLDPTIEELTEIKTGVSEAVSNAIIHGYKEDPKGIVSLECCTYEDGKVMISIEDEGVGIEDIEKAREPMFTTGKTEERSGMGFTVMESFMDKVGIQSEPGKGTKITLMKQLDMSYGM